MTAGIQLFDALPAHIEAALRESIARFGVLVPPVVDQHGAILDGHHRARIADELGLPYERIVLTCADDAERAEIARTLNADRRQLSEEQRRAVAVALREQGHSLRAIGGALGVDASTVHRDLSGVAPATPEHVTGLDGKSYPAVRPSRAERERAFASRERALDRHPELRVAEAEAAALSRWATAWLHVDEATTFRPEDYVPLLDDGDLRSVRLGIPAIRRWLDELEIAVDKASRPRLVRGGEA